ncbi:MAG TPA: DUF6444 domain-containing protein [Chloroflexota bacterium]
MTLSLVPQQEASAPAPEQAPHVEQLTALLRLEDGILRAQNAVLQARSRKLDAPQGQTSSNSSRPPSADPPQAPTRSKPPPAGRKRGGQPGRRGTCRAPLGIDADGRACTTTSGAARGGPDLFGRAARAAFRARRRNAA